MCARGGTLGGIHGDNQVEFRRIRARLRVAPDTSGMAWWATDRCCDVGGMGRPDRLGITAPLVGRCWRPRSRTATSVRAMRRQFRADTRRLSAFTDEVMIVSMARCPARLWKVLPTKRSSATRQGCRPLECALCNTRTFKDQSACWCSKMAAWLPKEPALNLYAEHQRTRGLYGGPGIGQLRGRGA
jgi:hypothetical protein